MICRHLVSFNVQGNILDVFNGFVKLLAICFDDFVAVYL